MSWIQLDDNIGRHPKVLAAGVEAFALWVLAIGYASQQLTDGFVPEAALQTLGPFKNPKKLAEQLVNVRAPGRPDGAGLFERAPGGYQIHDYLPINRSRAEALAKREEQAEKKRRQRDGWASSPTSRVASPGDKLRDTLGDNIGTSRARPLSSSTPLLSKETRSHTRRSAPDELERDFAPFWAAYPKKVGRQDALKAWRKLAPPGTLVERILAAIDRQKASRQWVDGYAPHAATWLRGSRWDDELEPDRPRAKGSDVGGRVVPGFEETRAMLEQQRREDADRRPRGLADAPRFATQGERRGSLEDAGAPPGETAAADIDEPSLLESEDSRE